MDTITHERRREVSEPSRADLNRRTAPVLQGTRDRRQVNFIEDTELFQALSDAPRAWARALDVLAAAGPYELGLPAFSFYNWPNLYPAYVRGEAFLAAHRGQEAAVEFRRILDHRSIVLNEPIGVLSHLQLGRAYTLQNDATKACAAYQDFLTI
jgi:hypothetical protein